MPSESQIISLSSCKKHNGAILLFTQTWKQSMFPVQVITISLLILLRLKDNLQPLLEQFFSTNKIALWWKVLSTEDPIVLTVWWKVQETGCFGRTRKSKCSVSWRFQESNVLKWCQTQTRIVVFVANLTTAITKLFIIAISLVKVLVLRTPNATWKHAQSHSCQLFCQ